MNKNYKGKVWATKILLKEVENELDAMLSVLLPSTYISEIEKCDIEVPGYPSANNYTYSGRLVGIHGANVPHWIVYSHSIGGVKAKLISLLFEGKPVMPLTN